MKKITNSADAFVEIGLSTLDQNALIAQNHPAMLGLSSIAHKNHNGNSNCSAGADGKIRNDFGSTASFALDASIPQINEKVVTRTSVQVSFPCRIKVNVTTQSSSTLYHL